MTFWKCLGMDWSLQHACLALLVPLGTLINLALALLHAPCPVCTTILSPSLPCCAPAQHVPSAERISSVQGKVYPTEYISSFDKNISLMSSVIVTVAYSAPTLCPSREGAEDRLYHLMAGIANQLHDNAASAHVRPMTTQRVTAFFARTNTAGLSPRSSEASSAAPRPQALQSTCELLHALLEGFPDIGGVQN